MENILFKQSFRGFDRKQVLDYIDDLSNEMSKQAENYTEIQKGLENEIQSLSDKLSENSEKLNFSQTKLEELTVNLAEIKRDNVDLKNQINTYRHMVWEKDKEISEIKVNYNQLSEDKKNLEEENSQWKAKQDEIAACMVEAQVRAKEIITQAHKQAEQTKAEFTANAANLMDRVTDVKSEIARLEEQLESSFAKLSDAMQNMDKASGAIENQVKEYQSKVENIDAVSISEDKEKTEIVDDAAAIKKTLTESVLETISKLLEK